MRFQFKCLTQKYVRLLASFGLVMVDLMGKLTFMIHQLHTRITSSPLPSLISPYAYNTLQAVLFLSIRPLSKSLYRRINRFLAELLWLQLIWLVDWWAGVKVIRSIKLRNPKSVSLHFGKAQMHPSQLFKGKKKSATTLFCLFVWATWPLMLAY